MDRREVVPLDRLLETPTSELEPEDVRPFEDHGSWVFKVLKSWVEGSRPHSPASVSTTEFRPRPISVLQRPVTVVAEEARSPAPGQHRLAIPGPWISAPEEFPTKLRPMPRKKPGNGHVGDLNSTILRSIEEKIERGFESIGERLDRVVENTGSHWRAHEQALRAYEARLQAIEQKLGISH